MESTSLAQNIMRQPRRMPCHLEFLDLVALIFYISRALILRRALIIITVQSSSLIRKRQKSLVQATQFFHQLAQTWFRKAEFQLQANETSPFFFSKSSILGANSYLATTYRPSFTEKAWVIRQTLTEFACAIAAPNCSHFCPMSRNLPSIFETSDLQVGLKDPN